MYEPNPPTMLLSDYFELSDFLPEGYELTLSIFNGEAAITLYDPEGDDFDICRDDMTYLDIIIGLINEARKREELDPIDTEVVGQATMNEGDES